MSAWLIPSACRRSRSRAPINRSIAFALLGDADFRLAFFIPTSTFDDLEKAIAVNANISVSVRMYRRFSFRHKNPVFTLYVRRQPGARHSRQAQSSVGRSAIHLIVNSGGHQITIARQEERSFQSVAHRKLCAPATSLGLKRIGVSRTHSH
jgi:hypothetical protein